MKRICIEKVDERIEFAIPESWKEVPAHLYPSLARLYLRDTRFMNIYDKMVRMLTILLENKAYVLKTLSRNQLLDLCKLTSCLLKNLDLTDNPILSFELEGKEYHAPKGDFSTIRFGEFVMAETYFSQYIESNKQDASLLDKLIAVLYRQSGTGEAYEAGSPSYRGECRVKFNSNVVEHYSILFQSVNLAIKDGILLWYAAARETLFQSFPNVFTRRSKSKTKEDTIDWGWFGVYDDLLGEKGRTSELLEDEFVSVILMGLERTKIKANENKKRK